MTEDPKLRAVLGALARANPRDDLVARLAFLVDWRTALTAGRQTTAVAWLVDGRGPRLAAVEAAARAERTRRVPLLDRLMPGRRPAAVLDEADLASLDHVLRVAAPMDRVQIVRLVMSVRPVLHATLDGAPAVADLPAIAAEQHRIEAAASARAA